MTDWENQFSGKKIAVLGLGVEGISSVRFFLKHGGIVTVHDVHAKEKLDPDYVKEAETLGVQFVLGEDYMKDLFGYDIVMRSPGIKALSPEFQALREHKVQVTSQTDLFLELSPCPVIGVTGTKGKGTTSSLIAEMLRKEERTVYIGGNIGQPPLDFLDTLDVHSWVVLELSSFQLQDVTHSPHIAVVLMITSEHLDYHKDTYEYIDAKRNILRFQEPTDYAVINRDYVASHESDVETNGKVFQVSTERDVSRGCFIKNGKVVLVRDEHTQSFDSSQEKSVEKEIIENSEILLPGKHNLENVCAAVMAATLAGVSKDAICSVLRTFKGLEHRLELVGEVNGVRYYDDSFSTVPETAIAAIEAFTAPEVLILGGSSKGSDFTELGKVIARASNIKAIIGVGIEWPQIKYAIEEALPENIENAPRAIYIEGSQNMHAIVTAASKITSEGDVVLLSPACASFDMFKNYKERGKEFAEEVSKLQ